MTLSTFTYAKLAKSHGITEFSNKIIEWKATCSKPHLHERGWSSTKKQISQCRNLHQDLHKTATSLIHRMNFRAAPFISELGEQRLHTDALYTQDKSSIMNISIYTYWKLAEPWQFKQSYRTPHRKHWSTVRISERLRDCTTSFCRKTLLLDPRSSKLETRSSCLETRSSGSRNSKCSSFEMRGSSLELRWLSVNLPLSGTVYLWAHRKLEHPKVYFKYTLNMLIGVLENQLADRLYQKYTFICLSTWSQFYLTN